MRLRVKLQTILDDRKITQKELAKKTGIRPAAISELCNNQRTSINRIHLEKISEALGIREIGDLMELEYKK